MEFILFSAIILITVNMTILTSSCVDYNSGIIVSLLSIFGILSEMKLLKILFPEN